MNVSKINMYSLNFGQVRKSAAQIAIKKANGNTSKLKKILRLVEGQKDNIRYDVIASKNPKYNYEVVDANGLSVPENTTCNSFDFACAIASNLSQEYEAIRLTEKIFANCKD